MTRSKQERSLCCLWLIAAILFASPATAFRTIADDPTIAGASVRGWASSQVIFELVQDLDNGHDATSTLTAAQSAMSAWNALGCTHPALIVERWAGTPSASPGDGRSTIEWTGGFENRGIPDDGGAYADVQLISDGGPFSITEVDIYLNRDALTCTTSDCKETQRVILHELGHALGLEHPCTLFDSTNLPLCANVPDSERTAMFPVLSGANVAMPDDIAGICYLYGTSLESDQEASQQGGSPSAEAEGSTPALFETGDPCTDDASCRSGLCSSDSSCVKPCADGTQCFVGQACAGGVCTGATIGASCSEAAQCASGNCIVDTNTGSFCTRDCSAASPCPSEWECVQIQGEHVCMLPDPKAGCACQLGRRSRAASKFTALAALLFAAALAFRSKEKLVH